MKHIVSLLKWMLKAGIFFTLFAFALNNQHDASLHLFFGQQWRSPMVLIVLAAFAIGLVVGVLGMAPRRWRRAVPTQRAAGPGLGSSAPESQGPAGPAHGL